MEDKFKVKKIENAFKKEGRWNFLEKRDETNQVLLQNIKDNMAILESLWKEANDHWGYEDPVYRYYHSSFKVYNIQYLTTKIFNALLEINPHTESLNEDFMEIYKEGTGQEWTSEHNREWSKRRPMIEAFFHVKYFLEMAIKYGKELKEAPNCLPSGWACLLYLYRIR